MLFTEFSWWCFLFFLLFCPVYPLCTFLYPLSSCHLFLHNTHPCSWRDSNPQSWQSRGHRLGLRHQGNRDRPLNLYKRVNLKWKPITTRVQVRPKSRWDDNVKQDICKMKIRNWTVCVQDRGKWRDVVKKAKTLNM